MAFSTPEISTEEVDTHKRCTKIVAVIFALSLGLSGTVLLTAWFGPGSEPESLGDRLSANFDNEEVLPLSQSAAEKGGWTTDQDGCDPRYGIEMQLEDRIAPILMYNANGNIVGMQINTDVEYFPAYPQSNLQQKYGAVETRPGRWGLVLWFQDPTKLDICEKEEDEDDAAKTVSVGDGLWLQMDRESTVFEKFPLSEDESILSDMNFTKGDCIKSGVFSGNPLGMGTHWYRNLNAKDCNQQGPMFLLYSAGKLIGFSPMLVGSGERLPTTDGEKPVPWTGGARFSGWDMNGTTDLWEFPANKPQAEMPACMDNLNSFNASKTHGTVTTATMHIFFSKPDKITCADTTAKVFFK